MCVWVRVLVWVWVRVRVEEGGWPVYVLAAPLKGGHHALHHLGEKEVRHVGIEYRPEGVGGGGRGRAHGCRAQA